MSTEQIKQANRRFYDEVLNKGNMAAVDELLAENYVSYALPPGLPQGREGIKMFIGAFRTGFPDGYINVDGQTVEGDKVVTRLTYRGTHTGVFNGIPPTGRQVQVPALDFARYEKGMLVEHWGGPDQLSLPARRRMRF